MSKELNKVLELLREIRPSIPKDVLELWCKDRDAFLASHKETVEQAGGDERVIGWRERILAAHPSSDPDFWPDALLVEHMAAEIADLRAALAQPSPAPADEKPGDSILCSGCFAKGVGPEHFDEAGKCLVRQQTEPLGAEFSQVLSDNLPELLSASQAEQAEAERPALWAVHAQGPDELYAGFSREDAEKHAAELNALPMPEGIAVGAVVVPSPWPEAEHWKYLAEQERDHKNEIAGRLRQFERICEGLPQGAIDGGWTVHGIRGYAKRLEDQLKAALARVAELETALEPFAAVADAYDDSEDDDHEPYTDMGCDDSLRLTLGQHRAGRIALEGRTPQAQAQHSVPEEFIGRLAEFLAQRGVTGRALLRDLRKFLAAAPGKEGV